MGEDEIRRFLNQQSDSGKAGPAMRVVNRPMTRQPRQAAPSAGYSKQEADAFQDFSASHLYCPKCRQAMPVREKLLLYLSDGDLYEYLCSQCGTSVGNRRAGH